MAEYYVRISGSDGNAGTSAGAAWRTLQTAMTRVGDGDTIWVGAGVYRISATIAPASRTAMTYLYGDVDGAKTGDAGEVIVTPWTSDLAAPSGAFSLFTLASKDYWTIGKLRLVQHAANNAYGFLLSGTTANVVLQDIVYQGHHLADITATFGQTHNITITRCRAFTLQATIQISLPNSASGSDYNANIQITNCTLQATANLNSSVAVVGTNTNTTAKGGGVAVRNCTLIGTHGVRAIGATYLSTTNPTVVNNCLIFANTNLDAATSGQISDNYNYFMWTATVTNVTLGANTISTVTRFPPVSLSHEAMFGATTRPYLEIGQGSPLLGWGGLSVPAVDLYNVPRPGSGEGAIAAAIGSTERSNNGIRETSTVPPAAGEALRIKGPGYHEFELAVGSNATTVGVQARYDSTYAGILPQLWVVNGGEAGVSATSNTMTAAANTWEKVTVGPFTPTKNGIVTVRLQSNSTGSNSNAYFGSFSLE